ncbi:MAG: hypothetical protein LBS27_05030 [Bifidobacteriaceae bacterium]|nr:hypothetical protein [Bifidobacteriaceae bacterium]
MKKLAALTAGLIAALSLALGGLIGVAPARTAEAVERVDTLTLTAAATPGTPATVVKSTAGLPEGWTVHTLPTGSVVAVPPSKPGTGEVTPLIDVGFAVGLYIYLNARDQKALVAGEAAALAVLICAVPGVGQVACAAITGVLVAAATWIIDRGGICVGNKPELEIHYWPPLPTGYKCVKR